MRSRTAPGRDKASRRSNRPGQYIGLTFGKSCHYAGIAQSMAQSVPVSTPPSRKRSWRHRPRSGCSATPRRKAGRRPPSCACFVARHGGARREPATAAAVKACADELQAALGELRELARGNHPAVLPERGLEAALQALAARSSIPVELSIELDARLPPSRAAALSFVAADALANVAKYARASVARVTLRRRNGSAEITIVDDGWAGVRERGQRAAGSRRSSRRARRHARGGERIRTGTTVRALVSVSG